MRVPWLLGLSALLALGACNDNGESKTSPRSVVNVASASGASVLLDGAWIGCAKNSPSPDTAMLWAVVGVTILATSVSFSTTDGSCSGTQSDPLWEVALVTSSPSDQVLAGWSDKSALQSVAPPQADFLDSMTLLPDPPTATLFNVTVVPLVDSPSAPPDGSTFQLARFIDDTQAPTLLMYGDTGQPSPDCDALHPDPPAKPTSADPYVPAGGCLFNIPAMVTQTQ